MYTVDYTERVAEEFRACQKILIAVGDETRQHLLCEMLNTPNEAHRVVDIAAKINLSRPAVSHHMQILKDAGVVKAWRKGTMIDYYLSPDACELERLSRLIQDVSGIMKKYAEAEAAK